MKIIITMYSHLVRRTLLKLSKDSTTSCCRNINFSAIKNLRNERRKGCSPQIQTAPFIQTEDIHETKEIWNKVNAQICDKSYGRLFAIIDINQHQHKLTEGDLVMILEDIGAANGQRIRLEKVLLIGSSDFTLVGRPLLPRDLVNVEATIVEKSLSHKKINFYAKGKREVKHADCKYRNHSLFQPYVTLWSILLSVEREHTTTLRINKIELLKGVDDTDDRLGFEKT